MILEIKEIARKVVSLLPEPKFTRFRNQELFEWMNQNGKGKRVLNLGSGVRQFDHYLSKEIKLINLDILPFRKDVHVVGDAHFLPFKNECFDIIYSIAVLEHVKKPWIVADEMFRILHPGGHVVLELPFLNIIHDEHDYFRFTDKGIVSLFDEKRFDAVLGQVSSGGGSFLSVFLLEYFEQFVPQKYLKVFWRISMRYLFCLLKYFDILIDGSKNLRNTANSFSFIGKKR